MQDQRIECVVAVLLVHHSFSLVQTTTHSSETLSNHAMDDNFTNLSHELNAIGYGNLELESPESVFYDQR